MSKEKSALSGKHISYHFPHIPKTLCVCVCTVHTFIHTCLPFWKRLYRRLKLTHLENLGKVCRLLKQRTNQASLVKWAVNWNLPSVVITQALSSFPSLPGSWWLHYETPALSAGLWLPPPQRNRSSNFQKETFIFNMDWFSLKAALSSSVYQTGPIRPTPTHQGVVLTRDACCF